MRLIEQLHEKPWGRDLLPPPFLSVQTDGAKIGEIWFLPDRDPVDQPVLVKYLFTGERLSVQVHPDDRHALERGLASGKNECWYILAAEPDAVIALGTRAPLSAEELREAALSGDIEALLDWKPVKAGEFYAVPAGTIHAIGAGIALIEFQQNADVTYRLYDYGRPRELHLDDALAVVDATPYKAELTQNVDHSSMVQSLVKFPQFTVLYCRDVMSICDMNVERPRWVVPLSGTLASGVCEVGSGGCLYLASGETLTMVSDDVSALVGMAV